MKNQVFLGGTAGNNNWRNEIVIPALLEEGVSESQIFDPIVDDWNAEAQANEDAAKLESNFILFYIANPQTPGNEVSAYSLVELTMGLYDAPHRTVGVFDTSEVNPHIKKGLLKSAKDLKARFPQGFIFDDVQDAITFLADNLLER